MINTDEYAVHVVLTHKHKRSKLALKLDKENRKHKTSKDFDQASAPFHSGELPSQFNAEQSELERVGRKQRTLGSLNYPLWAVLTQE